MSKKINTYFWNNDLITLRTMQPSDANSIYQSLLDPALHLQTEHGIPLPATEKKAENLVEFAISSTADEDDLWFAIENRDDEMVGYGTISWLYERGGCVQCNVVIFDAYRRAHYGSAAFSILLQYLFNERRMHKVTSCVTEGNYPGAAFLYAMGFQLECFRSEMFYTHGKYVGEYYFGMLENEYRDYCQSLSISSGTCGQETSYTFRNTPMPEHHLATIPTSTFGDGGAKKYVKPVFEDRPYFWSWNGITLRGMEEDDYLKNQQMLYHSWHCRLYDNDVKLPENSDELSEHAWAHLDFGGDDNRLEFAIMDENSNYVGNINMCGIDYKNGKFSLSIYTLPRYQGHGYGTKAIQLILEYAFTELRLNKLIVCVNDGNIASATMMRKAGLCVEGVKRETDFYDGHYVSEIFLGITKTDYTKLIQL